MSGNIRIRRQNSVNDELKYDYESLHHEFGTECKYVFLEDFRSEYV